MCLALKELEAENQAPRFFRPPASVKEPPMISLEKTIRKKAGWTADAPPKWGAAMSKCDVF